MPKRNISSNITQFPKGRKLKRLDQHVKPREPHILDENTLRTRRLKSLKPRLRELVDMLEYARPGGSAAEEAFIAKYIDTLPNMQVDAFGNRFAIVGKEAPTIAWSSHTDTVHYEEGKQAIQIDKDGLLALDPHSEASCLGADCTAGVWLMRRLMLAGKPGLYLFHREEESGGFGSTWIAENKPELVKDIKAMIALDRRGYTDVITEQSTGRTASNKFANSLAEQLGERFRPDDGGIFTDSAFYSHLVPECTNISVGYFAQHSRDETLDYEFIDGLLLRLLMLDYSKLSISRDPSVKDYGSWGDLYSNSRYYGTSAYGQHSAWHNHGEHDPGKDYEAEQWPNSAYEAWNPNADYELVDLIRRNPEATAHLLRQWDITEEDMYEAIRDYEEECQRLSERKA